MTEINGDEFEGRPGLVKKRARVIILQRIAWVVIGIYILGSLALLGVNAVQGAQTRNKLLDCTEPTGQCAQESQKATIKFIQQLIDANNLGDVATQRIVVLASACSQQPEIRNEPDPAHRIKLLAQCVNDQLDIDIDIKQYNQQQEGGD